MQIFYERMRRKFWHKSGACTRIKQAHHSASDDECLLKKSSVAKIRYGR